MVRDLLNTQILLHQKMHIVCLSLLTMTNPDQMHGVLLFVCSKMADETSLNSKLPVANRTREYRVPYLCMYIHMFTVCHLSSAYIY